MARRATACCVPRAPAASPRVRAMARRAISHCAPRAGVGAVASFTVRARRRALGVSLTSGRALLADVLGALALVPLVRVHGAPPHVDVVATAITALLPSDLPGAPTLSTPDDARSQLLPRGADARVRFATLPEVDVVMAPAAPPSAYALLAPEPTLELQPKAEALEAHLPSSPLTPARWHATLPAAAAQPSTSPRVPRSRS
jgi:hypothetical protein